MPSLISRALFRTGQASLSLWSLESEQASQWEDLLKEAFRIIDHVNRDHDLLSSWTFGGGTAMMLQINHRESHDVDLFLDDPQLLPYVTASVGEMSFDIGPPSYNGDGTGHLKIAFECVGEIDFIVTGHIFGAVCGNEENSRQRCRPGDRA